jgi:DNA-binding PadR family transcriptional regulator
MNETQRLILHLLSKRGPLYGLDLVELSDGKLARGTVYAHMDGLVSEDLVTSEIDRGGEDGIQRRLYTITPAGRIRLDAADEANNLAIARHLIGLQVEEAALDTKLQTDTHRAAATSHMHEPWYTWLVPIAMVVGGGAVVIGLFSAGCGLMCGAFRWGAGL